jgi:magnesium-transporting ATPase (P-type)
VLAAGVLHVKGAPDSVLPRCVRVGGAEAVAEGYYAHGWRVLAIARRDAPGAAAMNDPDTAERDLELLGLVALQDPPRDGVAQAIRRCRRAGINLALITGDHPATARAIADEVGLRTPDAPVVLGRDLPADDARLGELLDHDGAVVARVTPEDKLRIAHALQQRGHVVAMTGDGVNDGPALREADIGVAMGKSGTDVAREAADLVLLDDAFPTIVAAVELGRATSSNIRRFLTYHLTDNVAELTPFAVFALSGGAIPLALTVLMVLALDIGTDLLPALALGAEAPEPRTLERAPGELRLVDRALLIRVFGVLGPVEALVEMAAFVTVLAVGGWRWGEAAEGRLLLTASGTAFAAVVLGQLANAFACRSERLPAWRHDHPRNSLLLGAVGFELAALAAFLTVPPLASALELRPPSLVGWGVALLAVPAVLLVDAVHKAARRRAG